MKKSDHVTALDLLPAAVFSVLGIVFPVLFHLAGAGQVFLPMYLPVSAGAFLLRPVTAVMTGFCVPLVSSVLTGMPVMYPPVAPMMSVQLAVLCFIISFLRRRTGLPFPVISGTALLAERLVQFFLFSAVMPWFAVSYKIFTFYENIKSLPGIILMVTAVPAAALAGEKFLSKRSPVCSENVPELSSGSGSFMHRIYVRRVPVMKFFSAVLLILNISMPAENVLQISLFSISGLAVCMFVSGISLKVFVKRNLLLLVPAGVFFLIMAVSSATGNTAPDFCLMAQVTAKIFCVFTGVLSAAGWLGINGFSAVTELMPSGTFRLYIILVCREFALLKKDFLQIRGALLSRIGSGKLFFIKHLIRSFILLEISSFSAKQAVMTVRTCSGILPESLQETVKFRDAAAAMSVSALSAAGLIMRYIN